MKTRFAPFRQRRLRIYGTLATLALAAGFAAAQSRAPRVTSEITNSQMTQLPGSLDPMAQAQNEVGRMPGNTRLTGISLQFSRSAAQQADLEALLKAQQDPSSPQYHQWLTPDQFAARFGMAQADIDAVKSWLERQGFAVDGVSRSRNSIRFSGNASQVEAAFATQMHYYQGGGTKHFAPSTALSVPAAIAPVVEYIRDLSDFKPRPMHIDAAKARPGFTSSQSGNVFFTPGDIKTAYDMAPVVSKYDGTGQTIAVVGQSSIVTSDITAFQAAASLTAKTPTLVLVPGTGDPTLYSGDESESDLDLEWSGAMAPGADLFFVYTGNSQNSNGVFDSIAYAVDEKLANIISVSYGACELELNGFTLESTFQQAAAQGQSVFVASGDAGSTACLNPNDTKTPLTTQQQLAVSYPASSPYVTAVGGTEIDQSSKAYYTQGQGYWTAQNTSSDVITSALKYLPEVTWNDDVAAGASTAANGGGLSATGGGVSTLFAKQSWQAGVPGIPSDKFRDLPDVALYSSPAYVAYLYCTSDTSAWSGATSTNVAQAASCTSGFRDATSGDLTAAAGTSFATPIFAGMVALINQQQGYTTGQGLVNPVLYKLASNSATYASAFHDITSGNNYCTAGTANGFCSSSGATLGYKAGTGYDQVTGLGSVDLAKLAAAWTPAAASVSTLVNTTTTVVPSNAAPSVNTADTFTITVASVTGSTVPTGTVTLQIDGGASCTGVLLGCSGTTVASQALTANGTLTYIATFTAAGPHQIVAQYSGDATHAPSSGAGSVTIAVSSSGKGTFTLGAVPPTLTVSRGSSGTETISITPAGGYTGTVNLTYTTSNSTALANLCVYTGTGLNSSGGVVVSGTTAVSGQLSFDTQASDCATSTGGVVKAGMRPLLPKTAKGMASRGPAPVPSPNRLPLGVAFAGLLAAGFIGRYAKKLRSLAAVIALAAIGLGMTACGGGSSSTSTVSNPPKGTYTITIQGADSVTTTNTATATFTLTIN